MILKKFFLVSVVVIIAVTFYFSFVSSVFAATNCTVTFTAPNNGNVTITGSASSNIDGASITVDVWDYYFAVHYTNTSSDSPTTISYTKNFPVGGPYILRVRSKENGGAWNCDRMVDPAFSVVASGAPDLTASNLTPTTSIAGTATTFSATISNIGTLTTGATLFYNLFQVATDSNGTNVINNFVSSSMSGLAVGGSAVTTKDITFPLSAVDTTQYVRACADKANQADVTGSIVELNETTNNCTNWTPVMITGTSCGGGWGDPEEFAEGGPGSGPGLCANTSLGFCQPAPSGQTGGHIPSSNGNISTCCYGADNYAYMRQCSDPDLSASNVVPISAIAGSSVDFSATITNSGTTSTGSTPFTNLFQISSKSDGSSDVTNYVSASMSGLAAGSSVITTKTIPISSSAGDSTLYVRVCADKGSQADAYGVIPEGGGEGNNCSMWTPITIYLLGPDAPTTPTAAAGSCGQNWLKITWPLSADPTIKYHIFRDAGSGFGTDLCTPIGTYSCTTGNFNDKGDAGTGLIFGKLYNYKVYSSY